MPPALSNKPENFSQNVAATNRWAIQMEGQLAALQKGQNNAPNVIAKTVAQLPPSAAQQVELQVPGTIFTPADQIASGNPTELAFSLLPEPANTFLRGPFTANSSLDHVVGQAGGTGTPVLITTAPALPNELAFFFTATQGSGPSTPNPGPGWTLLPSATSIFSTIYYRFLSTIDPITIAAPAFGTPYAAVLALLGTKGLPVLAQAFTQVAGPISPLTTPSFTNANIAGNAIIVAVSGDNVTATVNGTIADTQGNIYERLISLESVPQNNQAILYVATNIAAGTNAITFAWGGAAGITVTAMEFSNIVASPGIPFFGPLVPADFEDVSFPFDTLASGTNTEATMLVGSGASLAPTGSGTIVATGLESATTVVDVSAATAPSSGQVLTATSSTAATWQTASAGGSPAGSNGDIQMKLGTAFTNISGRAGAGSLNADNLGNLTVSPNNNLILGPFRLGVFGGGPDTQQTVTGSRSSGAALTSLLSALAAYGLIVDSSTP